jgi:hypothetical protein
LAGNSQKWSGFERKFQKTVTFWACFWYPLAQMRALRARMSYVVCRMSEKEVRSKIGDSFGRVLAALRAKMERISQAEQGRVLSGLAGRLQMQSSCVNEDQPLP